MKILVLNDGFKGNLNQALGISQAFHSVSIKIFDVHLKGPSYSLPSRKGKYPLSSKLLSVLCILRLWKFGKLFLKMLLRDNFNWNEKFDIVISAGSILAPINLIISKNIKAYSVNIMVPSLIPLKLFDFAVIPYHDFIRLRNKNIKNLIVTIGAPNLITDELMEKESKKLREILKIPINKPIIGILIGGDDQNYTVSSKWIKGLFIAIAPLKEKYNLIITTSRRTGKDVVAFIRERIKEDRAFVYSEFPGYSEKTFYPGIISLCDYIFVTEDSINMVSEALTSGRPTLILGVGRKRTGKKLVFDKILEKLVEKGYAEYLGEDKIHLLADRLREIKNRKFNKLNEGKECALKILQSIR